MLVPLQKEPVIRGARGRVGGSEEAEKAEEEKRKRGEKRASSGRAAGAKQAGRGRFSTTRGNVPNMYGNFD